MSFTTLFADRPVGKDDDALWADTDGPDAPSVRNIRKHLEQIAETFVEPLLLGTPAPSLTIAVNGSWGSGKSSALCVLRDLAIARMREGAPKDADEAARKAFEERLVFCEYASPVWEATEIDARTTLVARMLTALAGSEEQAVTDLFLPAKAADVKLGDVAQPRDAEGRAVWSAAALEQISAGLSRRLQDFDALLRARILGDPQKPGSKPRVLVVTVDDLDRCDPRFVHSVLNELQQLGNIKNIFFVVAADEETLHRAVKEGAAGRARTDLQAEHELAKLVQHTVDVPELDAEGTRRLFARLFRGKEADPLARALLDNAALFWDGLPERTPRAVKRCLNALAYAMHGELSARSFTAVEVQKLIKTALLRHTWGDFYVASFEPLNEGRVSGREALFRLQSLLQRFATDGDRRLSHELRYLCEEYPLLPWRDLPLRLVRFLGSQPLLVDLTRAPPPMPPPASGSSAEGGGKNDPGAFVDLDATNAERGGLGSIVGHVSDGGETAGQGPDPDDFLARDEGAAHGEEPPGTESTLREALLALRGLHGERDRSARAARLVSELQAFEPESDGASLSIARALMPRLEKDPGDGAVLCAVLDRYLALLRRYGQQRTAGAALHAAYTAARQIAYVRDAYSMYLMGAGAVEAARQVSANADVRAPDLLTDDAKGADAFTCSAAALDIVALLPR